MDEQKAKILTRFDPRQMTQEQLSGLGVSQIAYVKPVWVNGARAFAIHGADGTPMALAGEEFQAFAAIAENEMLPARVH
jgi:hypothetical protein